MMLTELLRKASELLRGKAATHRGTEPDVDHDEHQALRRPVGGAASGYPSTTGSGPSGEFVGRGAGEDPAEDER